MKIEDVISIEKTINEIQYEPNIFTVLYGEGNVIWGAIIKQPEWQKFFSLATIYRSIIDVDKKIKCSIVQAATLADDPVFSEWDPFGPPSENEWKAVYYIEDAIFRTGVLWDLLAQWFNISAKINMSNSKVYTQKLFHDAQQGKKPNLFAKKVYTYMSEEDNIDTEPWKGNHVFIKDYRDTMTHRNAPSVSTLSEYATNLRMPAVYLLKRLVEDYLQVSEFLKDLVAEFTSELPIPAISGKAENCPKTE